MAKIPPTRRSLTGEIRKDREQVRRVRNGSPFFGTGFHPTGNNGIESDDFDGDLDAGDAGSRGWAFNSVRAAIGELFLRPGSITNDSLANPVVPGTVWQEASDFTVSPAWTNVISTSVTVPDGFTKASISAKGRITAFYNQGTSTDVDYLYAHLYVGSASSDFYPTAVTGAGGSGTSHVFRDVVLTGLASGDTVTFALQASTDYATWDAPSSPGNRAKLGASINWYR